MPGEVHRLEPVIDQLLDGLDDYLQPIREKSAKTDEDFTTDGKFDPSLKEANKKSVADAVEAFREEMSHRDPYGLALEADLGPIDTAVVGHVATNILAMPVSNPRRGFTVIHDSAEDARRSFLEASHEAYKAVDWWSSDSPFLVDMDMGSTTIYPSNGEGNVATIVNRRLTPPSDIFAEFKDGQRVSVLNDEEGIGSISTSSDKTLLFAILGRKEGFYGCPDDFKGVRYSGFGFIEEDGSFVPGNLEATGLFNSDCSRFAARAAIELLKAQAERNIPDVEVSPPSEEFRHQVIEFLARNVVQTFLPGQYAANVRHGYTTMLGYRVNGVRIEKDYTQIEASTEEELRAFLTAVDANVDILSDETDAILHEMLEGGGKLAQRTNAIKAQPGIDTFFESLEEQNF